VPVAFGLDRDLKGTKIFVRLEWLDTHRKCVHAELGWLSMERSLDDQNRALAFVCNLLRDTSQHGRDQSPTSSRRNLREYPGIGTIGIHFVSELSEAPCLGRDERDKLLKALGSIA